MDVRLLRTLVTLGVPGVALGVFYLLLKGLGFRFETIGSTWAAVIALVFILVIGAVTLYALYRWGPKGPPKESTTKQPALSKKLAVGTQVQISAVPQMTLKTTSGVVRWSSDMSRFCGMQGIITEISQKGALAVRLDIDSGQYWWAPEWLTPTSTSAVRAGGR